MDRAVLLCSGPTRQRPYVLSTVLETAARLRPDSSFVTWLVDDLLAARKDFGRTKLWSADAAAGIARVEASIAHTARAVTVLKMAHAAVGRPDVDDAVGQAVEGIVASDRDDGAVTEILTLDPDGGPIDVPVNHFTAAWVLRALAGSPGVPGPRVEAALTTIWDCYSPTDGLWAWRHDGQLPIWMTHDAIAALRFAALATFTEQQKEQPCLRGSG